MNVTFANRPQKNFSRLLTFLKGQTDYFLCERTCVIETKYKAFPRKFLGENNGGNDLIQM